jgi:hypothetical protein
MYVCDAIISGDKTTPKEKGFEGWSNNIAGYMHF